MRFKNFIQVVIILLLVFTIKESKAQLIAFDGAEGYGRFATGGRGDGTNGYVVYVTNLEDDVDNPPEGSFRWALSQGTEQRTTTIGGTTVTYTAKLPLTVVFKVGGVIHLKDELRVSRSNVTIAGQTAPGDGICFADATLNFSGSKNVIVRYIRSRPGDVLGLETSAFRIENGGNFIIDHCSFSWAIEETTHFSSSDNTTVQWCIISESLYNSIHKKGARGYGTQWGGEYASYHHNLLAHHNSRMPRINGSNDNDIEALVDYRNNVNYNWMSSGAFYGGEWEGTNGRGFCHTNVVNNYFKPGPSNSGASYFAYPSYNRSGIEVDGYAGWYFNGNTMEGHTDKTENNWLGVSGSAVGGIDNIKSDVEFVQTDGVLEQYDNYTETASEALESVLASVGAIYPKRDAHDTRVIAELKGEVEIMRYPYATADHSTPTVSASYGIIDTQNNLVPEEDQNNGVTPWDVYETVSADQAPTDTDSDGIPDAWETENGLNPQDSADAISLMASGYTNLEAYLANLVGETLPTSKASFTNNQDVKVYPNPANSQVNVVAQQKINSVEIWNLSGACVKRHRYNNMESTVNLQGLEAGPYFLRINFESGAVVYKKILKK